jgi:hypothetical protein
LLLPDSLLSFADPEIRKRAAPDYRVRDDRTQNLVNGWNVQMEQLVKAYMIWCAEADMGPSREKRPRIVEEMEITVVDLYGEHPALGFCLN